jgi:hypothetical protein
MAGAALAADRSSRQPAGPTLNVARARLRASRGGRGDGTERNLAMIERHWNADLLAKIFGFVFIAVGIAGYFENPLVSETGVFRINEAHNVVHIVTGALFFAGAYLGWSARAIRGIAVLYMAVAIIGFAIPDNMLFGLVAMNAPDRWLHAALAGVLLLVGFVTPAHEETAHARM